LNLRPSRKRITAAFIILDLADKRKVKCSCGIGTVTVLLQSINRDAGILRIGSIFMAHAVVHVYLKGRDK
jgi:hypothetical protein